MTTVKPTYLTTRGLFGGIPSSLDFCVELCALEVVVITEHAERVLGKEFCGSRSFLGVAARTIVSLHCLNGPTHGPQELSTGMRTRKQTYTVKQSHINANATGVTAALTSSGIGGVSPLAIL